MVRQIVTAVLAIGTLAASVPVAHAGHLSYDCVLVSGVTTAAGTAYGYVVSPVPGEAVSIRCSVEVDGTEVASTSTGTGTGFATTSGHLTYNARFPRDVKVCSTVSGATHSPPKVCHARVAPEALDAIDRIFQIIADSGPQGADHLVCGMLQAMGVPALVNAVSGDTGVRVDMDDCDIYRDGERVVDLIPYED